MILDPRTVICPPRLYQDLKRRLTRRVVLYDVFCPDHGFFYWRRGSDRLRFFRVADKTIWRYPVDGEDPLEFSLSLSMVRVR